MTAGGRTLGVPGASGRCSLPGDTGSCWWCCLGVRVVNGELFQLKSANRLSFLFLKTFYRIKYKNVYIEH